MILIFGSNGLLGSSITKYFKKHKKRFKSISISKGDIIGDIFNKNFLKKTFIKEKPEIILNLVALTNVDYCELNAHEAEKINSFLPSIISEVLNEISAKIYFIHISTDQIYNGIGPHDEKKNINPINVYSKTKLKGENLITYKNSIILRTNFFGKSLSIHKKSFTDWIFENMRKKNQISLFSDILFTPISLNTFNNILTKIINKKICGIYNLGSNSGMSKKDFAIYFSKQFDTYELKFKDIFFDDLRLKAKRPHDMRLSNKKIESALNLNINNLNDEIIEASKEYI